MNPWLSDYKSLQGNVGLGAAIAYYTSNGYQVLLPLNDTQKYDLVVDKDGTLHKVSVKTTKFKRKSGMFSVLLKNCGGSSSKSKVRHFNNKCCDILFILTVEGTMYEIPSHLIDVKGSLSLTNKWDKYIIKLDLSNEVSLVKN